jgi:signal transduction histidine kinase
MILQSIKHRAREVPDPDHGYTYLTVPLERGARMVAYTLMPTVRGDTMVYGLQYSADGFLDVLSSVVRAQEILPEAISADRRNSDLVEVAVRDAQGNVFYASDNDVLTAPMATVNLPPRFASLSVSASIKPGQAESLVVGGLPESRMPYLLGLLALAAGLTVVAVMQLRREAELSRVRAEWIASVSHELRTPLAQIRLYLDTLRLGRTTDPERQEWALSNVDRETTRLSHLVEKVLSFSRFGRGTDAAPGLCDVQSEVTRIVDEFRPLTASRNVQIETDVQPVPEIAVGRDSLRHVLLNLLDNAVKYGPAGQTVRVSVHRVDDDVRVTVQDQGPGVPPAEREKVWRAFARGASSQEQGGSGIGLTIVREVALQHGGRTWVEGAPGGGARFVVALPIPAPSA